MKCSDIKSSDFKIPIDIMKYTLGKNTDLIPIKILDNTVRKKAKIYNGSSLTLKRQEFLQAQGYNMKKCFEFVIRFMELDTTATVKYRGKEYEIKAIENVEEKNRYLLLLTERIE